MSKVSTSIDALVSSMLKVSCIVCMHVQKRKREVSVSVNRQYVLTSSNMIT